MNFSAITIHRLIVHKVFQKKRNQECSEFELSHELISTNEEVKSKIIERIAEACNKGSKALELEIADSTSGSFFDIAKNLRHISDEDFIKQSGRIAVRLAEKQTVINIPDSYLLIVDAISDDKKSVVIIVKAELQEALRTSNDKKNLELVKDLFLSPAIKFYKIGILFENSTLDKTYPNDEYGCILFDYYFSSSDKLEPAEYFYQDFLGLSIDNNAPIKTKIFYNLFVEFLKENTKEEEQEDLLSFIKSHYNLNTTGVIDASYIEENYIPDNLKSEFQQKVTARFPRPFVKNISLMKESLSKRRMFFDDNISIIAPENVFKKNIDIIRNKEELDKIFASGESFTLIKIKGLPYPSRNKE
ncbi:MAG: nucleoid-associated protein [Spirosomataceae bacterium]